MKNDKGWDIMQIDFEKSLKTVWKKLGSHAVMVLSTSCGGVVTSRQMSVVIINGKFYFQTDKTYLKYKQLAENPNASLCFKNYSVVGICKFIGKPLDEKNKFFSGLYKKYFYLSYKQYSHLANEVLVEFTPSLIYSWNYELSKPYMEYWNFTEESYEKRHK